MVRLDLDRSLPISVGVQLRGQLEYGVACGEIVRGSRLPSVRELSAGLGVAPATVSQVYKELVRDGLLETVPGKGTYVTRTPPGAPERNLAGLHRLADELLERAQALGYEVGEVAYLVQRKAHYRLPLPLTLVFVGIFSEATQAYAEALRQFLRPADRLEAVTLAALDRPEARARLAQADVVVTLAHREGAVRRRLGPAQPLTSVHFVPSEATRVALAALAADVRLGVVATFPEFLSTLKSGVRRYAPKVRELRSSTLGSPELPALLAWSEVVVFATGSEVLGQRVPTGTRTVEYRHSPDPRSVETDLLPLLENVRAEKRRDENLRAELATS